MTDEHGPRKPTSWRYDDPETAAQYAVNNLALLNDQVYCMARGLERQYERSTRQANLANLMLLLVLLQLMVLTLVSVV